MLYSYIFLSKPSDDMMNGDALICDDEDKLEEAFQQLERKIRQAPEPDSQSSKSASGNFMFLSLNH